MLRRLGVRSLILMSPYPSWLTEQCVRFWSTAGFTVPEVAEIGGSGVIYDLGPDQIGQVLDQVLDSAAAKSIDSAVLIAGTGAPSLPALDRRAPQAAIPLLSSNLAGAWALLEVAGKPGLALRSPSAALRRLGQRLAVG